MPLQIKRSVRIGLIADTHCPRLIEKLPDAVFDIFADVDVILHAGDVGRLWVLDELSRAAPVIAVHGNDETPEAQAALPFLQTLSVSGQRVVITHGHYPDLREEHQNRKDDSWYPKLARWASFGREHGAKFVINGHTHIPWVMQTDGVWLINPGTVIQGSEVMRQDVRTVAILTLYHDGEFAVDHWHLTHPRQRYIPRINLEQGFLAARNACMTPIIVPELETQIHWLSDHILPTAEKPLRQGFMKLARSRWSAGAQAITTADFVVSLQEELTAYPNLRDKLRENPVFAPYMQNGG